MPEKIVVLESARGGLPQLRKELERATTRRTHIESIRDERELVRLLRSGASFDMLVASFEASDAGPAGTRIAKLVRKHHADVSVILTSEKDDADAAAKAIRAGASEYLVCDEQLIPRVEAVLRKTREVVALHRRNRRLDSENANLRQAEQARFQAVGASPQFLAVMEQARRVAMVPRPVLIVGERGTGKELVARTIHDHGGKGKRPFLAVNCAAFPDTLLESELFGHQRGAFSGAHSDRRGKFEEADGGTLFLDEVGHMSLPFQQKILRVVEYGTLRRVGGSDEIRVSTRIIAATNANLAERMSKGEFLRDLYDRLAFETLQVPPLRSRNGDVELLARHFLEQFMREVPSFRGKQLSVEAVAMLESYAFPGNVRELKNVIERAVYRDTTNEITPEDIGLLSGVPEEVSGASFQDKMDAYARRLLSDALTAAGGNQARAARLLGMSYDQFRHHFRKHKMRG